MEGRDGMERAWYLWQWERKVLAVYTVVGFKSKARMGAPL